jgi:hypothetical protein
VRLAFGGVLLTLALLGCGGDGGTEPGNSEAEGTWAGTITGGAQEGALEWTLQETGGDISGNGSFSTTTDAAALTIEGTYSAPNLTLTIHSQMFNDFSFSGTVGEASMKGRLNGSGFMNRTVTLDRQ